MATKTKLLSIAPAEGTNTFGSKNLIHIGATSSYYSKNKILAKKHSPIMLIAGQEGLQLFVYVPQRYLPQAIVWVVVVYKGNKCYLVFSYQGSIQHIFARTWCRKERAGAHWQGSTRQQLRWVFPSFSSVTWGALWASSKKPTTLAEGGEDVVFLSCKKLCLNFMWEHQ